MYLYHGNIAHMFAISTSPSVKELHQQANWTHYSGLVRWLAELSSTTSLSKIFFIDTWFEEFKFIFLRSDAFWGSKFRGNMAGNDCWIFHEIASLRNWFHSAKLGGAKSTLCHQREKSEYFTLKRHANFMRANLLANVSASGMICPWLYCIWNTNVLTVWKIIPTIGITIVTLSCY